MSFSLKGAKMLLLFSMLSPLMARGLTIAYENTPGDVILVSTPEHPAMPKDFSTKVAPKTDAALDVSCTGIAQWRGETAYASGQQVIYGGRLYTSKTWNYNAIPGSIAGVWLDAGACLAGTTPPATCDTLPGWQTTTAYDPGQQVVFNNEIWTAGWWSYNDIPGGPAGVWTVFGACATTTTTNTAAPTTTAGP